MGYPPRVAPPGSNLHVRTRATGRELLFRDDRDYAGMEYYLAREIARHGLRCLAYCLMPNHVHFVLVPTRDNLADAMRDLISCYVRRFNMRWDRRGTLVERRYRVTAARDRQHLFRKLRYVALNPVKAGLAERPEEWPYSSYAATIGVEAPPDWLDVEATLRLFDRRPAAARREFRAFVEQRL
jgi:REP element-mobilizing transposase RayT